MVKKKSRSTSAKSSAKGCNCNCQTTTILFGIALVLLIGLSISISGDVADIKDTLGSGDTTTGTAQQPTQGGSPTPAAAPTVDVKADDDFWVGKRNAPVTIIEFTDFQCPFCGRFYRDTMPQLQKEYVDTGKVKLVIRDFPLSFHPEAQKGSEATECAADQGKYMEMHDIIFERQGQLNVASLKAWAGELGLDQGKFDSCLDSGKHQEEVQKDFEAGRAAGVTGTPSFFINGKKLVGAHPFATFKQVIDAELQ